MEGVEKYFLYRDTTLLMYSGPATFAEDSAVTTDTTYSYQLRVENSDGSMSIASEPTTYLAAAASASVAADEFQCGGVKGYIRLKDYANRQTRQWRIAPVAPAGVLLNVCA